jgi:hypothetical protein
MKVQIAILYLCVLGIPVFAGFVDSFEGATVDPFWQIWPSSGSSINTNTTIAHSGIQSLQVNDSGEQIGHYFASPIYGTFSIWYCEPSSSNNYNGFYVGLNNIGGWGAYLGSTRDKGDLEWTVGFDNAGTGIQKTNNWYQFEISVLPGSLIMSIDQQIVYSGGETGGVTGVFFAKYGGNTNDPVYLDDFEFTTIPEPATMSILLLGIVIRMLKRKVQ